MHEQLFSYITAGRDKGLSDETIKSNLILAGWEADVAAAGLSADLSLPAPPPPAIGAPKANALTGHSAAPVAVVSNFTTRGLEYVIMFLAMGTAATALGLLLHDIVDNLVGNEGGWSGGLVSYSTAALIVSLPIFLLLFLRLKRAERDNPSLHCDPSRSRAIQLTLVITFIIGIWKIISYLYSLLNEGMDSASYSYSSTSVTGECLHTLITLGIAGGIFAYFWFDAHRKEAS